MRENANIVAIGVDFGVRYGRAVVVRVDDGAEIGTAVQEYALIDGTLPASGEPLPPGWSLHDPENYRDVLRRAVPAALAQARVRPERVAGIAVAATTGSVLPTLTDGTPLCEVDDYRDRRHAYVKLGASPSYADRITAVATQYGEPWLDRYAGTVGPESHFAKALHVLEEDPELFHRAQRWIAATDWITWQLCGHETRNVCTAGYHGIHQDGRYPSREFLTALHPDFDEALAKVECPLSALGTRAGGLSTSAAAWTGLPEGIAVAVGNVDAHVCAAAAKALTPGQLIAILGTPTCHLMNGARLASVAGMRGVVYEGISAGAWGYEAGPGPIVDAFEAAGLPVTEIVLVTGPLTDAGLMQRYADVTRRPLRLIGTAHAPALGAAIHAAVAAGCYPDVAAASEAMGRVSRRVYQPRSAECVA
jgi:L-ribulokinase